MLLNILVSHNTIAKELLMLEPLSRHLNLCCMRLKDIKNVHEMVLMTFLFVLFE